MERSSLTECWVGFVLISDDVAMYGHQRQVHVHDPVGAELDAHLADRLQERQRLDVTHRAADLDQSRCRRRRRRGARSP